MMGAGKYLAPTVLALVSCLMSGAQAIHQEDGGHNGTCTKLAIYGCLIAYNGPGVLQPLVDAKPDDYARSLASPSMLQAICNALGEAVECLQRVEKTCPDMQNSTTPFSHIVENTTVPSAASQLKRKAELCNTGMFCQTQVNQCASNHTAAIAEVSEFTFTPSVCQSMMELSHCFDQQVQGRCRLVPTIKLSVDVLKMARGYCKEGTCSQLQVCKGTFLSSNPTTFAALDSRTCFLYRNFTRCAGNAVSECPALTTPPGTATPTQVSQLVGNACTVMNQATVSAMYGCSAFSTCLLQVIGQQHSMFLPNLCRVVQGVIGCAAESAKSCLGGGGGGQLVNVANALALKGEAMGCGPAKFSLTNCVPLPACALAVVTGKPLQNASFDAQCMWAQSLQVCGETLQKNCDLMRPAPSAGVKLPPLGSIAKVTGGFCNKIKGTPLGTCTQFMMCMEHAPFPSQGHEYLNGKSWCNYDIHALECALAFSDVCDITTMQKMYMQNAYGELLDLGCENTYDFQRSTTGGAQKAFVAVPLMWMVLLSWITIF